METPNPIDTKKQNIDTLKTAAKKQLTGGIAAALLAIGYFFYIGHLEQRMMEESGDVKVNVFIAMIYNSMGKMGGTALLGGIGVLLLVVYAVKMMNIKKKEQEM